MTFYHVAYNIYIASLLFACICSIFRFKRLDTASRVLAVLVCCALLNESAAYYIAFKYHNNLSLYSIYCFIEFGILCVYFNTLIDVFIKKNIGIYIGVIGITLGIINLVFLQHLNSFNSYFLFFEDLSVIGMSLFAFFRMLLKEDDVLLLYQYPHFWFISILVFFWSITFFNWGLYNYINMKLTSAIKINTAAFIVGTITYVSFGFVFLFYPKNTKPQWQINISYRYLWPAPYCWPFSRFFL